MELQKEGAVKTEAPYENKYDLGDIRTDATFKHTPNETDVHFRSFEEV